MAGAGCGAAGMHVGDPLRGADMAEGNSSRRGWPALARLRELCPLPPLSLSFRPRPQAVVNPQGLEARGRRRAWHSGEGRLKFIVVVRARLAGRGQGRDTQGRERAGALGPRGGGTQPRAGPAGRSTPHALLSRSNISHSPNLPPRRQRDKECVLPDDWAWGSTGEDGAAGDAPVAAAAQGAAAPVRR
jgi:hypothetical protein